MSKISLTLVNGDTARFECTFGRGCEGICCKNGRPSVSGKEVLAITGVLPKVLPHLRPEARRLIEDGGFTSKRTKLDQPMLRVIDSWCVFFNAGCVLHKVGVEDGDAYQYKPIQCALFPLEQNRDGDWYVRQWGYEGEKWDLFCLNPKASKKKPTETLKEETELAASLAE